MKIKQKHIGILAATSSIISSSLYWHAQGRQYVDQTTADTSAALGSWFFLLSLILWLTYVVIFIANSISKQRQ